MVNNKLNVNPRTMFCRDNLDIMQSINSDCIDLIYLDPPFNKKKTFSAPIGSSAEGAEFSDIFREKDIKDEWVETIKYENVPLHDYLTGVKTFSSSYNYCYLVYMAVRLIECHRILKNTGSIYLHCDPTMSHYLKIVMDCIFGEKCFRNEITWCYKGPGRATKHFKKKHDIILFYAKSTNVTFNYDSIRVPYKRQAVSVGSTSIATGQRTLKEAQEKEAEAILKGKIPEDWWDDIGAGSHMPKSERTGYPTQKPLALLERIIKASSNEEDIVLDPFCGCATACVAAEKLGRHWIGIDVSHKAYDLVRERLNIEVPVDMFRGEPNFSIEPPKRTDINGDLPAGNIYIISNPKWSGEYKVGIANDVKTRLNSYQTSDPDRSYKLEYSKSTPHYKEIEKHIHNIFETKHEWVVNSSVSEIKKEIKNYETKNR